MDDCIGGNTQTNIFTAEVQERVTQLICGIKNMGVVNVFLDKNDRFNHLFSYTIS